MSNSNWYKGNLHTHTTESDGDAGPEHVAEWYRQHGYDFLVLSDHNHLTVLDEAGANPGEWPLLIPGEEVTVRLFNNEAPVHINGIGLHSFVEPAYEESIRDTLQENIDRIRAAGGLPSINHPNYRWALSGEEIASTDGAWAMEVFNGHPGANNAGGGGRPGAEAMWDHVLSAGKRVFGVATDDSHHYVDEFNAQLANPGRGWVVVNAGKPAEAELMEAMSAGDFFASNGVEVFDMKVSSGEIVIEMAPYDAEEFTTILTGKNGVQLEVEQGQAVRFAPPGGQAYVRATVYSSRGPRMWTQPLFLA